MKLLEIKDGKRIYQEHKKILATRFAMMFNGEIEKKHVIYGHTYIIKL